MQAFDGPDAQASCGRREHTTVAPQALALLNDRFVRARAVDFAERIVRENGTESQVRLAWRLALGRQPTKTELESSTAFIDSQISVRARRIPNDDKSNCRQLALADLCQSIFALNEFIYVD